MCSIVRRLIIYRFFVDCSSFSLIFVKNIENDPNSLNEFEKPVIAIANAEVSASDTLEIKFRLGNGSLILFCFLIMNLVNISKKNFVLRTK